MVISRCSKCNEARCRLIGVARAAIPYPDWTKNIIDPKYDPPRGPYISQQLKKHN